MGEPDPRRVLHNLSVSSPWTPSSSGGFAPRTAALRFSQPGAGFARLPPCRGLHGPESSGGNYPDTGGKPPHYLKNGMTSVWEVDWEGKQRIVGNEHPTQKPLRLFEIPMEQHTRPGAIVLEPFSGSGSQIIAAEKLGRRCRAMELEPAFVDVAVRRWERATGKTATLDGDSRSFEEITTERKST